MPITINGVVYAPASELGAAAQWAEGESLVDFEWLRLMDLEAKGKAEGWRISVCRADQASTNRATGAQVVYELDAASQIRMRLVLRDGSVVIARRVAP